MKISNKWFISIKCLSLSHIPTIELCGVECGMLIHCERYSLSLFYNCLIFQQEWNKWSGVASFWLQYEQRGESAFLNLKSLLFRYKTLFINLYCNILKFVIEFTCLGNKKMIFQSGLKFGKRFSNYACQVSFILFA